MTLLVGLLLSFLLTLVIGISIGLVLVIAFQEMREHIYEGYSVAPPPRRYRSYLDESPLEDTGRGRKKGAGRHLHYR